MWVSKKDHNADVIDIVESKNHNLLWPYYREASRWHHSMVVRIVELQLVVMPLFQYFFKIKFLKWSAGLIQHKRSVTLN